MTSLRVTWRVPGLVKGRRLAPSAGRVSSVPSLDVPRSAAESPWAEPPIRSTVWLSARPRSSATARPPLRLGSRTVAGAATEVAREGGRWRAWRSGPTPRASRRGGHGRTRSRQAAGAVPWRPARDRTGKRRPGPRGRHRSARPAAQGAGGRAHPRCRSSPGDRGGARALVSAKGLAELAGARSRGSGLVGGSWRPPSLLGEGLSEKHRKRG